MGFFQCMALSDYANSTTIASYTVIKGKDTESKFFSFRIVQNFRNSSFRMSNRVSGAVASYLVVSLLCKFFL